MNIRYVEITIIIIYLYKICDVTLQLQYHYASMQMNATCMPIDSMLRNEN